MSSQGGVYRSPRNPDSPETSLKESLLAQNSQSKSEIDKASEAPRPNTVLVLCYCLLNVVSSCGIVFANKAVFSWYGFRFVIALTWIHTIFTWVGMYVMSKMGFFKPKALPAIKLAPLAFGFVGYIVLGNLSLQINSVGFYQIMKIATAPTVVVIEFLLFQKLPSIWSMSAVLVVCFGVGVATVTDSVAISNSTGIIVALAATAVTAMYQIWAGSKQKELQASSSQLLLEYTPQAILMLTFLVPGLEPMGYDEFMNGRDAPETLLGYQFTPNNIMAIVVSSFLGIFVSLSTFLVIGATSSLTYNIMGHVKTVLIIIGGVLVFGDRMPFMRVIGILLALAGIAWYTYIQMAESNQKRAQVALASASEESKPITAAPK